MIHDGEKEKDVPDMLPRKQVRLFDPDACHRGGTWRLGRRRGHGRLEAGPERVALSSQMHGCQHAGCTRDPRQNGVTFSARQGPLGAVPFRSCSLRSLARLSCPRLDLCRRFSRCRWTRVGGVPSAGGT